METGRCAQCHGDGPAGEPCAAAGCRLRRYHYVPVGFVGAVPTDDALIGRVVADFLVVGVVGAGGFGHVHHVLQLPLRGRPVQGALKRVRFGSEAEREALLARFESEADALASLSHPHIVRLLKAGIDGETPHLVIELVTEAQTLEREIETQGVGLMAEDEVIAIIGQTLNALEAAHAQGIVHRDVKPGNIMLQRVAGYDVFVRVVDFGLAKFIADSSQTERVMGTLDYMAPEQLRGRDIGPWTDLYALGLVLLAMLTGRPSFSGERAVLVNEKLDASFDPVGRALGSQVMDAARVVFLRHATAFDRHERYADVAAFRRGFTDAFGRSRGGRKVVRTRDLSVVPPRTPTREVERPTAAEPAAQMQAPRVAMMPTSAKQWPLLAAVDAARHRRSHSPQAMMPWGDPEPGQERVRADTVDEPHEP